MLTVRNTDGWPFPIRSLGAEPTDDGFLIRTGLGCDIAAGPACLTFPSHPEDFNGQENVVFIGSATPVPGGAHVTVDRALADSSLAGGRLRRLRTLLANGRALAPRLAHEAARRAQPVPLVRRPR